MAVHFAVRLSLLAFAAVSLSGAIAGDDFDGTLRTALCAGAVFSGLGFVLGDVARRAVEEQVESELVRWKAEQQDRLKASNEALTASQIGSQTGSQIGSPTGLQTPTRTDGPAAPPGAEERSLGRTGQTDQTDPTNPRDPKNQREPRTGAAKAVSKPAGKPAAPRGRA